MSVIKLTAKRQGTFPTQLCEELGVESGDKLEVVPLIVNGNPVWVLKPLKNSDSWIGSLKSYAKSNLHDKDSIRKSIQNKMKNFK